MSETDKLRLGVNIDHVATLRNARGGSLPDPVHAAAIAAQSGADGITAHLREDRRHIHDGDIERLAREIDLPLNMEMAATQEMQATLAVALECRQYWRWGAGNMGACSGVQAIPTTARVIVTLAGTLE